MDIVLLRPNVLIGVERVSLVCEGVCTSVGESAHSVCGHRWARSQGRASCRKMLTESDEVLHTHATSGGNEVGGVVAADYGCAGVRVVVESGLAGVDDEARDEGRWARAV